MGKSMTEERAIEGKLGETSAGIANGNLEVSISFGRFENDLLSWDRWSSFSQNKYIEEVEKCSTPGSVAKKKAYFEAHYKRIAAKKVEIEDQQKKLEVEIGDQQKKLEASLLMAAKNNGESLKKLVPEKAETLDVHEKLEADLLVEEKLVGEYVAVEKSDTMNQLKQVEFSSTSEPEKAYATQITRSVTSYFQSSDSQTDEQIKTDSDTLGVWQTTVTGEEKQKSNLTSEVAENIVQELDHETCARDSPKCDEAPTETDLVLSEVLKSNAKEVAIPKHKRLTKVLVTNTERNGKNVKKAPLSVMSPKSPQISSSTLKKLTPKSTSSMMPTTRSLAVRGSKSSTASSKSTSAEHRNLARRPDKGPGTARSALVMATPKTTVMEKMGNKDIVKRAFKSFQPDLNSMASPGGRSDPKPKQVARNAKEIKMKEPLSSQKGKEWLPTTGVSSENKAQATPLLASSRGDSNAQKGNVMSKVNGIQSAKLPMGSQIVVKSKETKEVKETPTKGLKQSHKFEATPLPSFYRGTGVSKNLGRKESPKPQLN